MKKFIFPILLFLFSNSISAQSTVNVKEGDLSSMNFLLGVYSGEAIVATYWQIENLTYLFVGKQFSDEEVLEQLESIIQRLDSGNEDTDNLLSTELWDDPILQEGLLTMKSIRISLKLEAEAFYNFVTTRDDSYVSKVEEYRTQSRDAILALKNSR